MGIFKQKVKVINLSNKNLFFEENFWVDTGALYSFIPEDYLKKIQAEPIGYRNIILADGRSDRKLFGFCNFEIDGLGGPIPCPVIFAPQGSLFLLGATALENFGVEVDILNRRLKPISAIIGNFITLNEY